MKINLGRWLALGRIGAMREQTKAWHNCSRCGGVMAEGITFDTLGGYSRRDGHMRSYLLHWLCTQSTIDDTNHDHIGKIIYINEHTTAWLRENRHIPGAKRVLDAIEITRQQEMPMR